MSEKRFSTDEIVATVMKWRGWDMDAVDEPAYKEIIARLRAADKLCMIMNKIANWLERQIALTERLEKVNRGTFDSLADSCVLDEKTYRAQLEEVRKAIADYEK